MILVEWLAVILALVPVILIEAAVYRRKLGITYGKALYPAGVANLASTFVGYPLAWILRLIGQLVLTLLMLLVMKIVGEPAVRSIGATTFNLMGVVVYSAWLPGDGGLWTLPAASLVGLVPAYFVSVYSEAWVLRRLMRGEDRPAIMALSYKANLASYFLLVAIAGVILVRFLLRSQLFRAGVRGNLRPFQRRQGSGSGASLVAYRSFRRVCVLSCGYEAHH